MIAAAVAVNLGRSTKLTPGHDGHIVHAGTLAEVKAAEDTGRFAPHIDLYLGMLNMQLTYDALKIIGFDVELMQAMGGEMQFMQGLAHDGKIAQGIFIATRK